MFPCAFEYVRARSVDEAVAVLAQYGDEARPLSGGQSLIPLMKLRIMNPSVLVDLNPIPDLDYIQCVQIPPPLPGRVREGGGDVIAVGALARHADLAASPLLRAWLPMAVDAAMFVGDAQVRNLGTLAGAAAEADPGGDWGPVLLALGAQLVCRGPAGMRTIAAVDFHVDYLTTALQPDEILTEVRLPIPPAGSGGAYLKLERRSGDFAVVGAAVQLTLGADGVCQEIGIGLAGVGATPIKATAAEAVLRGSRLEAAAIDEAGRRIEAAIEPATDVRATANYRRAMAGVYFRRALNEARGKGQPARGDGGGA